MEPNTTPITIPTVTVCLDCDGPLDGRRYRCPPCLEAAHGAVAERRPGQSILPSDIVRVRERLRGERSGERSD